MEIKTKLDFKSGIRSHKVAGYVTFEEAEKNISAIYSDPDFDPEMNSLWDMSDANLVPLTNKQIRDISKYFSRNLVNDKARSALVVSGDIDFSIARMIERDVFGLGFHSIMVFRNLDSAKKWLGIK